MIAHDRHEISPPHFPSLSSKTKRSKRYEKTQIFVLIARDKRNNLGNNLCVGNLCRIPRMTRDFSDVS